MLRTHARGWAGYRLPSTEHHRLAICSGVPMVRGSACGAAGLGLAGFDCSCQQAVVWMSREPAVRQEFVNSLLVIGGDGRQVA